ARSGLLAVAVPTTILLAVCLLVIKGLVSFEFDTATYAVGWSSWINEVVGFGVLTAILAICLGSLLTFYTRTISKLNARTVEVNETNRALEQEIASRVKAQEKLEWELQINRTLAELYLPLLSPSATIADIADTVLVKARVLTDSEFGYVSEIDPATGENVGHTLSKMMGDSCIISDDKKLRFGKGRDGKYPGIWGHSLNTRKAFFDNNPRAHPCFRGTPEGHIPIERFLSVPVEAADELVGQIALGNPKRDYANRDLEAVQRLAKLCALGIRRRRDEKALQQSEERYRTLVETMSEGLVIGDEQGVITYCNEALLEITGYNRDDLVGADGAQFIQEADKADFEAARSSRKRGESDIYETTLIHKGGQGVSVLVEAKPILERDGSFKGSFAVITDITERKRAEDALRKAHDHLEQRVQERTVQLSDANARLSNEIAEREKAEDFLQLVLDSIPTRVVWKDRASAYLGCNKAFAQDMGLESPEEVVGKTDYDISGSREEADFYAECDRWVMDNNTPEYGVTALVTRSDGSTGWVETDRMPLRDREGKVVGALGTYQDITARKEAEEALKESEERYRALTENSLTGVYMMQDGEALYLNDRCAEIVGYSREEILGKHFSGAIHPEDLEMAEKIAAARMAGEPAPSQYEVRIVTKSGETRWVENMVTTIRYRGRLTTVGNMADITDRKRMEEQLRASLKEKEVLMREIHHRVKNNLQIVSGLLTLQSDYIQDENLLHLMKEAEARINTMARVHETLYESPNLAEIKIQAYITAMLHDLIAFYESSAARISLITDIEDLSFDVDTTIPCGLILNELVTNAMKYAFPDVGEGEVRVTLKAIDGQRCELVVSDNGIGIPETFDVEAAQTLGLRLVNAFVKKLDGEMEVDGTAGAEFKIKFKVTPPDPAGQDSDSL
ncbi:PAS domain S-box protein, partial [Thermodesulfobacteriota bacterium]